MMPGGNGPEWPKSAYIPRAEMDFTLHCFYRFAQPFFRLSVINSVVIFCVLFSFMNFELSQRAVRLQMMEKGLCLL